MELLLNLVWITLAVGELLAFEQSRCASAQICQFQYLKGLIVVAWVVLLLFPIVSASHDLRPAQAVLEDATKRIQQVFAPLPKAESSPFAVMLSALAALHLLFAVVALLAWNVNHNVMIVLNFERRL